MEACRNVLVDVLHRDFSTSLRPAQRRQNIGRRNNGNVIAMRRENLPQLLYCSKGLRSRGCLRSYAIVIDQLGNTTDNELNRVDGR